MIISDSVDAKLKIAVSYDNIVTVIARTGNQRETVDAETGGWGLGAGALTCLLRRAAVRTLSRDCLS